MQYFKFLFVLLLIISLGCEQVDDLVGGGVDAPNVSYSSTTLDADFYQAGSSPAPSINWNGDQGTITLGTTLSGLSVNSTTGQLSWTKMLPPGTHTVDVVVTNSEGQVVVPVTIENPLTGTFTGTYNGSDYFSFDLMSDGTIHLRSNSATSPNEGNGTWELDGDDVRAVYSYDGTYNYAFRGAVEQTSAKASIMGEWYYDNSFSASQVGGTVEVDLE